MPAYAEKDFRLFNLLLSKRWYCNYILVRKTYIIFGFAWCKYFIFNFLAGLHLAFLFFFCNFVVVKRTGIIFFTFFYLIMSSAFAVNVHYCGGELDSVYLIKSNDETCCGMDMTDMDCCKTEFIVHQPSDNTHAAQVKVPGAFAFDLFYLPVLELLSDFNAGQISTIADYAVHEPVRYHNDTYLRCRVLLIW